MEKKYVLALDQGTTSSRAIVFDRQGTIVTTAQKEFEQIYPQPGWVEHDPMEIWATQIGVAREALERAGANLYEIAAIGITNQRETTVVWEKSTGKPVYNAIVWQCRRTAAFCDRLKAEGREAHVRAKTGLVIDAYFSGTKLAWILEHIPNGQQRAADGELLFGTIDTWLLWKITGGRVHATDPTNAARTMIYDIHNGEWDDRLLARLDIPRCMLPQVLPSSGIFGETDPAIFGGESIPVAGIAGDQQSALFGQCCFEPGRAKATYGTGCFILTNTGTAPVTSHHQLLTTTAWKIGNDATIYALEGSVYNAGSAVQWLRDEMHLIKNAAESETIAQQVPNTGGVYVVPAFTGMGAPYWDMYARGAILGITRGTNRAHIVRATLEAICWQTREVLDAMHADGAAPLQALHVDGGATTNNFMMQFQADVLGVPVIRPKVTESTALGAAMLAGLATDFWQHREELEATHTVERVFEPNMDATARETMWRGWKKAVGRASAWEE